MIQLNIKTVTWNLSGLAGAAYIENIPRQAARDAEYLINTLMNNLQARGLATYDMTPLDVAKVIDALFDARDKAHS